MSADLPIPGYDGLALGELQTRLRTLDAHQLLAMLDYEKAHANRALVLTIGEARLSELEAGDAEPSGGAPDAPRYSDPPPAAGGNSVGPSQPR